MQNSPLTPRARQMFGLIEKYLSSGLTQRQFCRQEELSINTFLCRLKPYLRHGQKTSKRPMNSLACALTQSPTIWCKMPPAHYLWSEELSFCRFAQGSGTGRGHLHLGRQCQAVQCRAVCLLTRYSHPHC